MQSSHEGTSILQGRSLHGRMSICAAIDDANDYCQRQQTYPDNEDDQAMVKDCSQRGIRKCRSPGCDQPGYKEIKHYTQDDSSPKKTSLLCKPTTEMNPEELRRSDTVSSRISHF